MVNPGTISDVIDCTHWCQSKQHAICILGTISKRALSDLQIASFLSNVCYNFAKVEDETGKTALHMAAACGKVKLCSWLIMNGSNLNKRDKESGWTPVHMAAYRGHIITVSHLIKFGGRLDLCGNDGFTPLDLLFHAVSKIKVTSSLHHPYVWGSNSNFTLGIGTDSSRKNPEVVDQLKHTSIKQVVMGEKHSIFVGEKGEAWACGVGRGGRLGSGNEWPALAPVQISLPKGHTDVISAAVGDNHSLLLLSSGVVLSFGSNSHGQLGTSLAVEMTLSPRIVGRGGPMDGQQIIGICCGKYHSVMYSEEELFVCGLNSGQLGLLSLQDPRITSVIQVPIKFKGGTIASVVTCVGVTVVTIVDGDVYILQNYIIRKISHTLFGGIKQIALSGGQMNHKFSANANEHSSELIMLVLNKFGHLYWCDPESLNIIRVITDLRPGITFNQITLAGNKLFAISNFQEAYEGVILKHSSKTGARLPVIKMDFERVPNIFRGMSISVDPKGMNFAVLQVDPLSVTSFSPSVKWPRLEADLLTLLEEASEDDSLHDVVFKVDGVKFPCHAFILSFRGNLLYELSQKEKEIAITDTSPQIFKQLLMYLYTGVLQLIGFCGAISHNEDPLKKLGSLASRFKIDCLSQLLSQVEYANGTIAYVQDVDFSSLPCVKMSRNKELSDITLVAEDGALIHAHRCILTSRSEYFHSMLLGRWIESGCNKVLKMPFVSGILTDIVDFLYTEESPSSVNTDNLDYVTRLLMAADQLMISNLQEVCQQTLAKVITLKNAQLIFELSEMYNQQQLNKTLVEFFCMNIMFYIESRQILGISDELLAKITKEYRSITKSHYFDIAPWSSAPLDEEVISAPSIQWPDSFDVEDCKVDLLAAKSQAKSRKRTPKKSTSFSSDVKSPEKPAEKDLLPASNEAGRDHLVPKDVSRISNTPLTEVTLLSDDSSFPPLSQLSFPPLAELCNQKTPQTKLGKSSKTPFRLVQKQSMQKKRNSSSECNADVASSQEETSIKVTKGWAVVPPLPSSQEFCSSSPSQTSMPADDFDLIIESDREKRNNFTRMMSKPFNLTQIEEQAIAELRSFYNTESEFEESISIKRLLPTNMDQPQWTKNTKKLFV